MATNTGDDSDFENSIMEMIYSGFSALGVSMGFKLGLFDVLSKFDEPKTSQEIADVANYKERYVREWLGAMVVSKIVTYDPETKKYHLPVTHRETLCGEVGAFSLYLPALTMRFYDVTECFKKDGPAGLPYGKHLEVDEVLDRLSEKHQTIEFALGLMSLIPNLQERLATGITMCEIGCGTGRLLRNLAGKFLNSSFVGYDFSEVIVCNANKEKDERNMPNIRFETADVHNMQHVTGESYDLVLTYDVIHDLPYPKKALMEIHRILKMNGIFMMAEEDLDSNPANNICKPVAKMEYVGSLLYCMSHSLNFEGGAGLGPFLGEENAKMMLSEAGFRDTETVTKSGNLIYISSK